MSVFNELLIGSISGREFASNIRDLLNTGTTQDALNYALPVAKMLFEDELTDIQNSADSKASYGAAFMSDRYSNYHLRSEPIEDFAEKMDVPAGYNRVDAGIALSWLDKVSQGKLQSVSEEIDRKVEEHQHTMRVYGSENQH